MVVLCIYSVRYPDEDYYYKVKNIHWEGLQYCNWASEVSPTLGCSIEISRDIYVSVCLVCQINCVGGMTWPTRMLKVIFGR